MFLVAVLLVISRYSGLAAVAMCPMLTGSLIAYSLSPTQAALKAGVLSAAFWTVFTVCAVSGFTYPPAWNATESVFASLLGGYLGARIATS